MDGCMRAGPTLPAYRLRRTPPPRSTPIPASPASVPGARRCPAASKRHGAGSGLSSVCAPVTAQAEPHLDVVAVEVYRRGLAQLLTGIDREGATNIRLVRGDGIDVLEHMFGPDSLTGVRVFFPDPWPKARHHKRRLIQPVTVALIADRLRNGGVLHAATDHAGYAEQIADVGDVEPRLCRVTETDALPISVYRPDTKYETKARHAGSAVAELLWEKRR